VLSIKGRVVAERELAQGRCVIGRTSDNDLQIDSTYISRHHAQVVTTSDGSLVEDLNSTNGIFVRGKRVRRHRFADGDVVRIGMHEITYHKIDHLATSTGALDEDDGESDEDDGIENEDAEETEEERDR